MVKKRVEPERIAIPMPARLIERIDEYRWSERVPSRAAAIRALIEIGLHHVERQARHSRSSPKDGPTGE
jgi:metal-responsive CopG/Arc/MetJ family transcriptional regulator